MVCCGALTKWRLLRRFNHKINHHVTGLSARESDFCSFCRITMSLTLSKVGRWYLETGAYLIQHRTVHHPPPKELTLQMFKFPTEEIKGKVSRENWYPIQNNVSTMNSMISLTKITYLIINTIDAVFELRISADTSRLPLSYLPSLCFSNWQNILFYLHTLHYVGHIWLNWIELNCLIEGPILCYWYFTAFTQTRNA